MRGYTTERISNRVNEIKAYREVLVVDVPGSRHKHWKLGDYRPVSKVLGVTTSVVLHVDLLHSDVKIHRNGMDEDLLRSVSLEIQSAIETILRNRWQDVVDGASSTGHPVTPTPYREPNHTSVFDLLDSPSISAPVVDASMPDDTEVTDEN
jgi:hypothetical protein